MEVRDVRVYNVGFGDGFLLKLREGECKDELQLLVDLGSTSGLRKGEKDNIIRDVNKEIGKQDTYGMITHFHQDHMNLIDRIEKGTFKEFYFPNFISKNEIKLQLYVLRNLSKRTNLYKFAYYLLTTPLKLLVGGGKSDGIIKEKGIVWFVKKGDKIVDNKLDILWPNNSKGDAVDKLFPGLLESGISKEDQNQIEDCAKEYLKLVEDTDDKYIITKSSENTNRIANLLMMIENIGALPNVNIKYSRALLTKIGKIQNLYSIVFHEKGNVLFLGDIDRSTYENKILGDIKENSYKLVKVPHHGTKNYFSTKLPKADKFVITNNKHRNWDITAKYVLKYPKTNFYCTNKSGCEICQIGEDNCKRIKEALGGDQEINTCGVGLGKFFNINL